jgi:hypothetical protein
MRSALLVDDLGYGEGDIGKGERQDELYFLFACRPTALPTPPTSPSGRARR